MGKLFYLIFFSVETLIQCIPVPSSYVFRSSQSPFMRPLPFISSSMSFFHLLQGQPLFLLSVGTYSSIIFGQLVSSILFTWPYQMSFSDEYIVRVLYTNSAPDFCVGTC
uniref:Secreted protein n=1 Tax=Panstrongylus lignarius TaxID=156445 RepID=A0A224Y109_9HEMI